ncbi:DNA helicase/primase complex-associated protein, partial [Frankliniella fusca]
MMFERQSEESCARLVAMLALPGPLPLAAAVEDASSEYEDGAEDGLRSLRPGELSSALSVSSPAAATACRQPRHSCSQGLSGWPQSQLGSADRFRCRHSSAPSS